MAGEGTGMKGKRPFVDLDDVQEPVRLLPNTDVLAPTSGPSSGPSSSTGRRQKTCANVDMPGKEYLEKSREIAVRFYEVRSMNSLRRQYIGLIDDGFQKLCEDLSDEVERRFEESEQFNNYTDFWLHREWLDKQMTALTTNIVTNWTYYSKKKPDARDLSDKEKELVSKLKQVQQWAQSFSTMRRRKAQRFGTKIEEIQSHCVSGTFQWLPSSARIVRMPEGRQEGGYGWVRKVMITKLTTIPSWILFAEKSLKSDNEMEKRREIVSEAGGCPVKHPGIIRLAYLHPKTMAGYTLWWNGGSLDSFWRKYDSKVDEGRPNEQIGTMAHESLTVSELGWVATYRTNRINLALSLLMIVRACHDAKYIHNDISTSNVLLHFDEEKANTVYIGLCDWGLSSRVVELAPSKYGYKTKSKVAEIKVNRPYAAPELFFVYGEPGSANAYEVENKKHLYSMAADAYAAGWIAKKIWAEEYDIELFRDRSYECTNLELKIESLLKEKVDVRASVSEVLDGLTKAPHNWTMPSSCFRT